jgi:hypothetical protein
MEAVLQEEAGWLLDTVKAAIKKKTLTYYNRPENRAMLSEFGITASSRDYILASLELADYCYGPDFAHSDSSKSVMIFGKMYRGKELYIKFIYDRSAGQVACISCHEATDKMIYPLKI